MRRERRERERPEREGKKEREEERKAGESGREREGGGGRGNSRCSRGLGRGRARTACKHLSLQNTAESLSSVLKQTSTWSNFTKEETSALATVVLESVKSSTLAAFLNPSANVSQTVRAEHLGTRARFPPGAGLERGPGRCDSSPLSHIPFPQWFQTSEVTEEPVQGYEQHLPFTEWLTLS